MNHTRLLNGPPRRPIPSVRCAGCGNQNENVDWQESLAGPMRSFVRRSEGTSLKWVCSRCHHSNEQRLPLLNADVIDAQCENCSGKERLPEFQLEY